jgi:putative ABC transport system ATP-binding protein
MIVGKNIVKHFDELVLFDGIDFFIDDGDFVCFSGASGKGKTTLLNIIGLIEPYDDGDLIINGVRYSSNRQKLEYYRTQVGFLFQNFALIDNKTVEKNLELVSLKNRTDLTIPQVLDKVGLSDKIDNKVYTLSGGEQQRVALARKKKKKCNIILADEPTGSLDAENAQAIMDILMELNREGKTVIMVSHDEKIKKIARRVIEL